ncbi:MAG TPA: hypothetical protein VGQ39_07080 [Pyrinomonadaceae bacterium]|jgi:hypothetical protein|nr:hypothetical protein [Pyrinomonadaceae bacterium]
MLNPIVALVIAIIFLGAPSNVPPNRSYVIGQTQSTGNPHVRVWVNTNSGVYHCPNTRWYGNTKQGQFMTQKEAQAKGYRPAYGSVCG